MKAIITVGVSASGKTTFANDLLRADPSWLNINRDDIRVEIFESKHPGKEFVWSKWNWKWESIVTMRQSDMITCAMKRGMNILISDTNLHENRRKDLIKALTRLGFDVEIKLFEVSFEEALRRDAARKNGVGVSVIAKQFEEFNAQFGNVELKRKLQAANDTKARAVLVDVDGTLANHHGIRSPFEWHKVGEDTLHDEVCDIVKALRTAGEKIVIVSGRDAVCRTETAEWLRGNGIEYDDLFMRDEGDMRSDDIVKAEILEHGILQKYGVKMVIDDRPRVCNMWRSLGIPVIQVGNPYIFF